MGDELAVEARGKLLRIPHASAVRLSSPSARSPEARADFVFLSPAAQAARERGMNGNGNNKWAGDKAASAGVTARHRRGKAEGEDAGMSFNFPSNPTILEFYDFIKI
ncbi:unnamed protein product [Coccothraustes coccothraustes]